MNSVNLGFAISASDQPEHRALLKLENIFNPFAVTSVKLKLKNLSNNKIPLFFLVKRAKMFEYKKSISKVFYRDIHLRAMKLRR